MGTEGGRTLGKRKTHAMMRHSLISRTLKAGLLAAAIGLPLVLTSEPMAFAAQKTAPAASLMHRDDADFQVLYPGIYSAKEKEVVAKYLADNQALKDRGPIDVQALVHGTLPKDTPGVGPVVHATEAWVRYDNDKYDPKDPIRSDAQYARKIGFQDILAYPTFATNDDIYMVPWPVQGRDKLLVSELSHSVTTYKPIYPGDDLYLVANERTVTDLTPPTGSTYRSIAIQTKGSVYNQRGEKVNDVIFRVTENIRVYKDPSKAPANPGFGDIWVAPDWLSRPAHVYSDQDWVKIKDIWSKEKRRGAEPLYWEDVKVGDQPAWTLDGPIEASVMPIKPWGMGAGGSRTLKAEMLDPAVAKTLVRGAKDGIYRLPNPKDEIPALPEMAAGEGPAPAGAIDTTDIHKDGAKRSPLVNFMGRDFAIRQITNWMGDRGWLETLRWSIMDARTMADHGYPVPHNPDAEHWLDRVPFLKGKYVNTHGLTQDVAIVKSYVTAKYVRDTKHMADLVWWIETIDGHVFEEGMASVVLPSKAGA